MESPSGPTETQMIQAIVVPREIVNADSVYFVSWLVPDATVVEASAAVCEIETSKAIVTIEAERKGYLRHRAVVGEEVSVGGVLGYIAGTPHTPLPTANHTVGAAATPPVRLSAKAKRMIEERGLDLALFAGYCFVRESDVVKVAATLSPEGKAPGDPRGQFSLEPLGPIQRRVAHVLGESIATIPTAYLERSIDLAVVRERAQEIMRASKILVSPVDLVVAAVARAATQFPRFNGFLTVDYQLQLFDQVNVGVAVDVGADLYVVVVKEAASKSPEAIARELRTLQYLAERRRLGIDQLTGGTITVTSMIGHGIERFHPILYPQQAAIVGISEIEADSTSAVLTLGFDHRIANGSQAAAFLVAIDRELRGS